MAYAALLWAGQQSSSASSSPSLRKVNAEPIREVAEISDIALAKLQRGLPTAMLPFGDAAASIIEILFSDVSRHGIATKAAAALGASDDTITRIISGDTKRIDAQLLFRCLALYQHKFSKPFPIGGGFGLAIVEGVK
jgi:hypothetical protein